MNPNPTLDQIHQSALLHHRSGNLQQAEALCREILRQNPRHADALHLLSAIAYQVGRHDIAIDLIRQVIALKPGFPEAHNNLGIALRNKGRFDEAIAAFRVAIALQSDYPEAHLNLANALYDQRRLDEAIAAFRRAIAVRPDYVEAVTNLGNALNDKGEVEEAIAVCRRAIILRPDNYRACNNLGNALKAKGQLDEAMAAYRQAIALQFNVPETHSNLGDLLKDKGELDEAIAACRQAISLKGDHPQAHCNLGNALKDQGQLDDAIAAYRRAVLLDPSFSDAHSNLAYAIHFHPEYGDGKIEEELRRWNQQHAEPLRKFIQVHCNDRSPERRLRIGYVSPDFRNHTAGLYLFPLIRDHDRERFHITCYGNVARPDAMTEQFRRVADGWRNIRVVSDERAAQVIRDDAIDILVDTTLHMGENRLPLFARKPAPVQATLCGYPGTTGVEAMDYRLSDPWLDPPGPTGARDGLYIERTIRLPDTFWCYDPLGEQVGVGPVPALSSSNGNITFGCLNNFCKINERVLVLWARVMGAVAGSRLLILAPRGSARDRILEVFAREGIDRSRIDFVALQSRPLYLQTYQRIDVCLDPFPYNGHWTTLDALWMGVPVVSLLGKTVVGRGGLSILSNMGLRELVASSEEQYVQIACELARDLARLSELRSTLRGRMERSPLMDTRRFTREVEEAYRGMWRMWCGEVGTCVSHAG